MDAHRLAAMIDHTNLKPDASKEDFATLCAQARNYGFAMVAINPYPVAQCAKLLAGTQVRVGAAVAFPLGQTTIADKVAEACTAIDNGADEIDYVVNITELKAGNLAYIEEEMERIVAACRRRGAISKVIFENCYLTDEDKRALARIAASVRPDFVKTSTGFGPSGATLADVRLMKEEVGEAVAIKAAGGIRSLDQALAFVEAGATRIGTSRGCELVDEMLARS